MIDRNKQNIIAKRLFEADPERGVHDDGACWVAACLSAHRLLGGDDPDRLREFIVEYYGKETIEGALNAVTQ